MWYWRISTRWKAIDTPPITGVPEELSTTGVQGKKALIQKQTLRKMRAISVRTRRWIDDKSSIENESPEDQHVTINDISTIQEINAGQLGLYPQTGGEIESPGQTEPDLPTHQHNYKLRPWPTGRNRKYIMMQGGNQQSSIKNRKTPCTCADDAHEGQGRNLAKRVMTHY